MVLLSHVLNGRRPVAASIFAAELYAFKASIEQLIANGR